jgi:Fe-S-cluster containining protein
MERRARLRTEFTLTSATPFSYACKACNRCCHDKIIPINPYEIARLASLLGISSTDFRERHTETGGATLARRDVASCVFLGPNGCTVHSARPLACRLYPLGRHLAPDGSETYAELVPHPESEGVYATDGTVADFLRGQDIARHIAATDRYYAVLKRMLVVHAARADREDVADEAAAAMDRAPTPDDDSMLDMDVTVARYCAKHGLEMPGDVEEKTMLHIAALEEIVAAMEAG